MAKLVVFGAGDIARLAHFYFSSDSEHEVVAFTVDAAYKKESAFQGLPLVASEEVTRLFPPSDVRMFVALSYAKMNRIRAAKYTPFQRIGIRAGELREQPMLLPVSAPAW